MSGNGLPPGKLEGDFRADVLLAACRTGRMVGWLQNAGLALLKGGGAIHVGLTGIADIIGVANDRSGRLVAFELKSPKAVLTKPQVRFLRRMRQLGAAATLYRYDPARSWDENVAGATGAVIAEIEAARWRAAQPGPPNPPPIEDTRHGHARTHDRGARQPRARDAAARRQAGAARP